MYKEFSDIYNQLMEFDYNRMINIIKKYILLSNKNIMELGCGSGLFTKYLIKEGAIVDAIEPSEEMLMLARKEINSPSVRFFLGDMKNIKINKKYSLAIAAIDVLNYISPEELEESIENVYNHIEVNGMFIFDVATKKRLFEEMGDNTFFEEYDDFDYVWDNFSEEDRVYIQLTMYKKENEYYKKYIENQVMYYHDENFKNILEYFFEIVDIIEEKDRIYYITRKRSI